MSIVSKISVNMFCRSHTCRRFRIAQTRMIQPFRLSWMLCVGLLRASGNVGLYSTMWLHYHRSTLMLNVSTQIGLYFIEVDSVEQQRVLQSFRSSFRSSKTFGSLAYITSSSSFFNTCFLGAPSSLMLVPLKPGPCFKAVMSNLLPQPISVASSMERLKVIAGIIAAMPMSKVARQRRYHTYYLLASHKATSHH